MKPLENIRVVDFTRFFAGPYCTQLLGDYGAEVIKIESLTGDEQRLQGPPFVGSQGVGFMAANRNKKAIAVNLKTDEGKAIALKLIEQSDVVVENFRRGVADRLGIGFEAAKKINPNIIYCSISGFGSTGPKALDPAFDLTVQAFSGFMGLNGLPGGEPVKPAVSIGDLMTGVSAFAGIEGAVLRLKNNPDVGAQQVATSLFETLSSYLTDASVLYQLNGQVRGPSGSFHANITPYGAYRASDGYIAIGAGHNHMFKRLCQALDLQEEFPPEYLEDSGARFQNRETIRSVLEKCIASRTVAELTQLLTDNGIPSSPVNTVDKAVDSQQSEATGMKIKLHHDKLGDMHLVGPAVKQPGVDPQNWTAPPELGEHTDEVLSSILGMDADDIVRLRTDDVIK